MEQEGYEGLAPETVPVGRGSLYWSPEHSRTQVRAPVSYLLIPLSCPASESSVQQENDLITITSRLWRQRTQPGVAASSLPCSQHDLVGLLSTMTSGLKGIQG